MVGGIGRLLGGIFIRGNQSNFWRQGALYSLSRQIVLNVSLVLREIDLRCKYSNTRVRLTAEFKPFTFSDKIFRVCIEYS